MKYKNASTAAVDFPNVNNLVCLYAFVTIHCVPNTVR